MTYTSTISQISRLGQLDSKTRDKFSELGIESSSLGIIADMVSPENSVNTFEIILKMAKSHKSTFHTNSEMKDAITTRVQGKDIVVGLREKKNWEKHTAKEPRNDPNFETQYGKNLIDKYVKLMGINQCDVGISLNELITDDNFQQRKEMRESLRN